MARTPLFPADGQIVNIKQGKTGDCYLLVILDAILQGGSQSEAALKSLFRERPDGSVEVRLQHGPLSENLKHERLAAKGYDYHYDADKNQDVFIISPELLDDFDTNPIGVRTNALAVKILEHLIPYYYFDDWHANEIMASVQAHDIDNRHGHQKSTEFTAALLGFEVDEMTSSDMDAVIQQKIDNPSQPIYMSMSWGKPDIFGRYHGRHALRIDHINQRPDGNHQVVVVNPWDNSKTESFYVNDIRLRSPRFSIFKPFDLANKVNAKHKINQALSVSLDDIAIDQANIDELIQNTISNAVAQVKKARGCSVVEARKQVMRSLLSYIFTGNLNALTRKGGLRQVFYDIDKFGIRQLSDKFIRQIEFQTGFTAEVIDVAIHCRKDKWPCGASNEDRKQYLIQQLVKYSKSHHLEDLQFSPGIQTLVDKGFATCEELLQELGHEVELKPIVDWHWPEVAAVTIPSSIKSNIENAIAEKQQPTPFGEPAISADEAKQYVYKSLIKYALTREETSLTRAGGLRDLFVIKTEPAQQAILKEALADIDLNQDELRDYIKDLMIKDYASLHNVSYQVAQLKCFDNLLVYQLLGADSAQSKLADGVRFLLENSNLGIDKLISDLYQDNDDLLRKNVLREPYLEEGPATPEDNGLELEDLSDPAPIKHHQLIQQLEAYAQTRKAERAQSHSEYHFFWQVYAFFASPAKAYSAQNKIEAAEALVDYLKGGELYFNRDHLLALKDGRLSQICNNAEGFDFAQFEADVNAQLGMGAVVVHHK